MKYHITHISLAFTLGMSFTALPRSATSCHHWLACLICPRIPREISWSLFIRGSIWQTGVFSSYFSFFNNLVDIQKQLQEKQRGDELVSRRNKSPFLLFWPMLQRRLQLHHSQDVLWCLAASSTLLLLPLLLDWHGRSWHRQAGEAFTDFGTAEHSLHRKGRFWSAVPQLCARSHLRGQQATVLAMDWWGKDRNSTCPNAFTLPVTQIPKMIQAKLSCVGSSLVMWNCSLYTLVAIWARAAFLV